MATPSVFKNCKFYIDGYDFSGSMNTLALTREIDEVEYKVFGNAAPVYLPGLEKITFEHQGYASSSGGTDVEDIIYAKLSDASVPMMVCPLTGAVNEQCHFAPGIEYAYQWGGAVGEMNAFTVKGGGQGYPLILGCIMLTGAKTATATGTAYQLGEVTAAQYLYAQLHVFAQSGTTPTLDVTVESDDAEGFSSPTTRITFAQIAGASVPTAVWATPVAGAITDTWWRVKATIGGSDPSFTIAVAVGIR
jgi:hypothetical protein